jgi:hypothetical protein
MKKLLSTALCLSALTLVVGQYALAATEGVVNATVTMQQIVVTVASGSVTYGTLAAGSTTSTVFNAQLQTATNGGNVNETFNIKGSDATGTTQTWILSGSAGDHTFKHGFCKPGTCTSIPGDFTNLTYNYATLAATVSAAGTQTFHLYINTPTVTTDYTEHTTQVTVQASAA